MNEEALIYWLKMLGILYLMMGRYQSGQLGQTVNLLSYDFAGSNPALPTAISDYRTSCLEEISFDLLLNCGRSSVGRATAFQAVGRGFEPRRPLELPKWNYFGGDCRFVR